MSRIRHCVEYPKMPHSACARQSVPQWLLRGSSSREPLSGWIPTVLVAFHVFTADGVGWS